MLQQHGSYMFVYYLSPKDKSNIPLHLSPSLIIYGFYNNNNNNNNNNDNNNNDNNNNNYKKKKKKTKKKNRRKCL